MFLRVRGAAPVAPIVVAIIAAICAITAVAIGRVSRQHEVLRLGYQLTQQSKLVSRLREAQRQLQVERATLTSPDRIKHLATSLGMTTVAPDRIRVIDRPSHSLAGTAALGSPRRPPMRTGDSSFEHRNDRKVALLP